MLSVCEWKNFSTVAKDEGGQAIKSHNGKTLKECQKICDETKHPEKCNSFGWCPDFKEGTCFLRSKSFDGTEALADDRSDCTTYYTKCTGKSNPLDPQSLIS